MRRLSAGIECRFGSPGRELKIAVLISPGTFHREMLPDLAADRGIQDEAQTNPCLRSTRRSSERDGMVSAEARASSCLPIAGQAASGKQ